MHSTSDDPPLLVTYRQLVYINGVRMAAIAIHNNSKARMVLNAGLDDNNK